MPGGPTTPTTHPAPPIASVQDAGRRVLISHVRPTRVVSRRPIGLRSRPTPSSRRAGTRLLGALDVHHFGLTQLHGVFDQPRGGLAEHHPAGRRADSIRCAMPTCSPIAV